MNDDAPTTIKLGEIEYSAEELEGLVADGKYKREVEEKQNTKLDKLMGGYTKLTEEKKTWETERAELDRLKAENEKLTQPKPEYDEATIAAARAEAKKIGLLTQEDVQAYVKAEFPNYYANQRAGEKILENAERLEKEIDGTDGRPKFEIEDVVEFMKMRGINDPLTAYKIKYETEIDKWKETKLNSNKREGLLSDSDSSAGGKTPPEVRPTSANLKQLFAEALREGK